MKAIFAVNALNGFGDKNGLPWPKSKNDLKRFKDITTGHTVVMGRSTWDSDMPKPLPNRRNIVLSKTLKDSRCEVYRNISDLLMELKTEEETYIIGGATILWSLRHYVDEVILTRFYSSHQAEITLDVDKYLEGFQRVSIESLDDHSFEIYKKIL